MLSKFFNERTEQLVSKRTNRLLSISFRFSFAIRHDIYLKKEHELLYRRRKDININKISAEISEVNVNVDRDRILIDFND